MHGSGGTLSPKSLKGTVHAQPEQDWKREQV